MPKKTLIGDINKRKYAKPPTWEQIESFIEELSINRYAFERFYGIPYHTLTQVKAGTKQLGSAYWHIIYERIKPAYGVGFIGDYSPNVAKKRINHYVTDFVTNKSDKDGHSRLGRLKE